MKPSRRFEIAAPDGREVFAVARALDLTTLPMLSKSLALASF